MKKYRKIRTFFQRFCLWNAKIRLTLQTAIQLLYSPIYTAIQVLVFFNFFVIFLRLINHKQTSWDDNIITYISSSLFKQKSLVNRDKSHLDACMIPTWSFESPIALASPGLPLLLRTHLNPSICALTMQSCCYQRKHSYFMHSPRSDPALIIYPSKEKYPKTDRFLELRTHLMKNTKKFPRNGKRIGRELGPVPTLSKSKMADS